MAVHVPPAATLSAAMPVHVRPPVHSRHEVGTDTAQLVLHALEVDENRDTNVRGRPLPGGRDPWPGEGGYLGPGAARAWIALPVGRAESGPSIAELVQAVRDAGGMVGGEALFDPRYEAEMRRFLMQGAGDGGDPRSEGR